MWQHQSAATDPPIESVKPDVLMQSEIDSVSASDWVPRYTEWSKDLYENAATHTPTPNQKHVLETIHFRVVKENYELLHEDYSSIWAAKPADIQVEEPLLRLVHGLPGSGKSKLLLWIKDYFRTVWQWKMNNQFSIVAPQNSMADNVGGDTLHSFGNIPFKDHRGKLVNTHGFLDDEKQSLLSTRWHNLRFLFVDEIEAVGVNILGEVQHKMTSVVPFRHELPEALKCPLHPQRKVNRSFGGVNVIFFGDFWQLDPAGSKSFMSNPNSACGDARADMMMTMFWHASHTEDTKHHHLQPWRNASRVFELTTNIRTWGVLH